MDDTSEFLLCTVKADAASLGASLSREDEREVYAVLDRDVVACSSEPLRAGRSVTLVVPRLVAESKEQRFVVQVGAGTPTAEFQFSADEVRRLCAKPTATASFPSKAGQLSFSFAPTDWVTATRHKLRIWVVADSVSNSLVRAAWLSLEEPRFLRWYSSEDDRDGQYFTKLTEIRGPRRASGLQGAPDPATVVVLVTTMQRRITLAAAARVPLAAWIRHASLACGLEPPSPSLPLAKGHLGEAKPAGLQAQLERLETIVTRLSESILARLQCIDDKLEALATHVRTASSVNLAPLLANVSG